MFVCFLAGGKAAGHGESLGARRERREKESGGEKESSEGRVPGFPHTAHAYAIMLCWCSKLAQQHATSARPPRGFSPSWLKFKQLHLVSPRGRKGCNQTGAAPSLGWHPRGPLRTSLPRPAVTVAKLEVVQATERLQTLSCPVACVCDVCRQLIWTPTGTRASLVSSLGETDPHNRPAAGGGGRYVGF